MPSLNHIHTYIRHTKKQYKCRDPYCSHFNTPDKIKGKISLCTMCGAEFILTGYHLTVANPRCINCMETKEAKEFRAKKELLERIGIE